MPSQHAEGRPLLRGGARGGGVSSATTRRAVLCTLAVQNACQVLSMRYSRMPGQPKYLSSTAVVLAEVTKILVSLMVLVYQHGGDAFAFAWNGVVTEWRDTMLVGVPALLYLIQNNLLYVATTHLDAATCQVRACGAAVDSALCAHASQHAACGMCSQLHGWTCRRRSPTSSSCSRRHSSPSPC